ncbi:hypothetical protein QKC54_gp0113 [Megavirus baoshan]|uniref:Uncharacterized protein n=1 Tax=Megavirus baoshan TaxID=2496520 RepID=A0A3S8UYN0_9VIRU|nr:hypothetical protein QKC54_gp0113 [Megavirus baoshan]AZL89798.1 hypothetical protein Mb0959 [Megavirus baoshan]
MSDFYQKYKKYKLKYLLSKNKKKSLFYFELKNYGPDNQIIIVYANDKNDAVNKIKEITNEKVFTYKSEYADHDVTIDDVKNIILSDNIEPNKLSTPLWFSFYNG